MNSFSVFSAARDHLASQSNEAGIFFTLPTNQAVLPTNPISHPESPKELGFQKNVVENPREIDVEIVENLRRHYSIR